MSGRVAMAVSVPLKLNIPANYTKYLKIPFDIYNQRYNVHSKHVGFFPNFLTDLSGRICDTLENLSVPPRARASVTTRRVSAAARRLVQISEIPTAAAPHWLLYFGFVLLLLFCIES